MTPAHRVSIQNVPVCTGTTRTCFNTRTRGAGTHGDVLNVHAEAFFESHVSKKSPSDELFLHFSAKVQNLAVFHLFT